MHIYTKNIQIHMKNKIFNLCKKICMATQPLPPAKTCHPTYCLQTFLSTSSKHCFQALAQSMKTARKSIQQTWTNSSQRKDSTHRLKQSTWYILVQLKTVFHLMYTLVSFWHFFHLIENMRMKSVAQNTLYYIFNTQLNWAIQ